MAQRKPTPPYLRNYLDAEVADLAVPQSHIADAAAATAAALTDNSGGTASQTLADVTEANNAGSADRVPVENAIASLADEINKLITDVADLRTQFNALLASDETAGIRSTS